MNILEVEDIIKGLPDQALQKEAQAPSGQVPQFLVVSEIQRRTDMRKRFQSQQQEQPQGTVSQQIVQEGIASIAPPPQQNDAAATHASTTTYASPANAHAANASRKPAKSVACPTNVQRRCCRNESRSSSNDRAA